MAPKPQDTPAVDMSPSSPGERVVISGMAGLYPESLSVKEFEDILYNKINPVTSEGCRWNYDHPEVVQFNGKAPGLILFDAQFFKVHYRLGNNMDSMSRKLLEQAFEAIYDAGVNSDQLSGQKIGVYTGSCFSETEKSVFYLITTKTGFGIMGCSKSMFANRISYWLNAKGPSMAVDQACCSSVVALELAYQAMKQGVIDSALVGGASLCLLPHSSVNLRRVMNLNQDGKTKSFSKNGCGCSKSDAINIFFLQKASKARRIYAEVVHVKSEFSGLLCTDGDAKYGFYREPEKLVDFLNVFYKEANVDPNLIQYVEAVGSATPDAEKAELQAIEKVFCKNRSDTLYIGSVMSNIGYTEAASGTTSITKVLLGYERGEIASNLHCEDLRDDLDSLQKGVMKFVSDHQPFGRGYTAINNLSVTGVNAHVLLKGHHKPKDLNRYKSSIPHLVNISGRHQAAVEKIIKDLKSRPVDPEEIALFHSIHQDKISSHMSRGYILLDTDENNETISLAEKAEYFDDATRPLWFVYSGMGSQWAGMGTQLMRVPVFAAAIHRCHEVLKPKGLDLLHIITSPEKTIFDNILHSFVGIAAVQIGLTDVLTAMGIVPDKIIGHSVGELGCAYADGCLTADEMILSAYSRGLVSTQTPFIKGTMAAVGIGYAQISKLCPPEIEVACHNSAESSTISGPSDIMKEFVQSLTAKGIFAKEVPSSNIAYHSRYIAEAGPGLLKYLREVITTPRARSERWVSTSVPQERWHEPLAQYSSAEYHTNNLLNSVLFEETAALIPKNAVLVEIAPHGLLQAILKRSHSSCVNIPLTHRSNKDNAAFMLQAFGKLFTEGFNPKISTLYPKVEFPVSTGTPKLGHLIEWAHTEKWSLPLYQSALKKTAAACKFVLSVHDDEHAYLRGHVVKEKNLYPFSAALMAVWDTFTMSQNLPKKDVSVQFRDVHFYVQPILHDKRPLNLIVAFHRGTGAFEVSNDNMLLAKGRIVNCQKSDDYHRLYAVEIEDNNPLILKSEDIYKLLQTRDYSYSGDFRAVQESNIAFTKANITWNDNWVTFIDGLLQLNILKNGNGTVHPKYIRRITIDLVKHNDAVGDNVVPVDVNDIFNFTRCGGVLMENICFRELSVVKNSGASVKKLQFRPHFPDEKYDVSTALYIYLQIVHENIHKDKLTILELTDNNAKKSNFNDINKILADLPDFEAEYSIVSEDKWNETDDFNNIDVIMVTNLSANEKLSTLLAKLPQNTLLINKENTETLSLKPPTLFSVLSNYDLGNEFIQLLRWHPKLDTLGTSVFTFETNEDLDRFYSTVSILPKQQKILLIASYPPLPTLEEAAQNMRKSGRSVNIMVIHDELKGNEEFPVSDLVKLVLKKGEWGGNYYLPIYQEASRASRDVILQSARLGDVNSLHWAEAPALPESGIHVNVHFAGINEIDVKKASGVIRSENGSKTSYGMDYSGVTDNGTRVMGLVPDGSARSRLQANTNFLWPVPQHWSLEDAATVPFAYSLAFYCLAIRQKLLPRMKVLIHGGTGALGQAAIAICLAHDCEVFTTVSDTSKKHFLRRLFPKLKEDHIGNSRDLTFGDMVMTLTNGCGCDIVLNCSTGDLKNISIKCCAPSGTVLDTALLQHNENFSYGMYNLTKSRNFMAVDFSSIFKYNNESEMRDIQAMVSEGIVRGYVRPLTRVTFPASQASRAARLLGESRHRGRVLLHLQEDISTDKIRLQTSTDKYHVVISDNDVLAIELLQRLVDAGARRIQLIISSKSNLLAVKITSWQKLEVKIDVIATKLWDQNAPKILDEGVISDLQGVYTIVSSNNDIGNIVSWLERLDTETRNGSLKLRYFVIINENHTFGDHICVLRQNAKYPATFVQLSTLGKNGFKPSQMSIKSAIDGVEKALLSQNNLNLVHVTSSKVTLLEEISALADIIIPSKVDENTTLMDLGLDWTKATVLQAYLRDQYNFGFEENEILNVTIKRLRKLQELINEGDFETRQGLANFYSNIATDELEATTEMVFLPTLTNSDALRHSEFDASQLFLCIVPGVEGQHQRFVELSARLKLPALVLQPPLLPTRTLTETAQIFAETLTKLTKLKTFYLLGYESGVIVALEMAAILEKQGLTGVVFCLGGTPKEIKSHFASTLSQYKTEEALQEAICRHMMSIMSDTNDDTFEEMFQRATTWHDKVTICVRSLMKRVSHSAQYAQELIEAAYSRIVQVKNYSVKPQKLYSKVIFLRPNNSDSDIEKHSLQEYSYSPIVEYELDAPLSFAAQDMRCGAIINRHLEKSILKEFEQKNLCETYLLNNNSIMTEAL